MNNSFIETKHGKLPLPITETIKNITPDLKDFDKMVLFEFKIALDNLVDSNIVMIDKFKVKDLLYESEMKVYKRLTTTHIEVE